MLAFHCTVAQNWIKPTYCKSQYMQSRKMCPIVLHVTFGLKIGQYTVYKCLQIVVVQNRTKIPSICEEVTVSAAGIDTKPSVDQNNTTLAVFPNEISPSCRANCISTIWRSRGQETTTTDPTLHEKLSQPKMDATPQDLIINHFRIFTTTDNM